MKKASTPRGLRRSQGGATLIEILVSMVILMVGLLGLVGVMIQSQRAQVESYQRIQALMLVQDMATRLNANKSVSTCYALTSFLGTNGMTVPAASTCAVATATLDQKARVEQDLTDWNNLLLGSAELSRSAPCWARVAASPRTWLGNCSRSVSPGRAAGSPLRLRRAFPARWVSMVLTTRPAVP